MALASYKYKTMFIHIYKCGGMTVRHAMTGGLEEILAHHSVAKDVKQHMGEEWDSFFKFAFIRNPFDWMISFYAYVWTHKSHFLHTQARSCDLNDFIKFYIEYCKIHPMNSIFGADKSVSQWDYVTDNGEVIVDYLGKVETIADDMAEIQRRTGCAFNQLGHYNKTPHPDRSIYNQMGIDLMLEHYEKDFKLGNYGDAI